MMQTYFTYLHPKLQEVFTKSNGKPLFIVGGGSSLSDFDFSLLDGHNVIAINSAYKFVHDDAILFWMDESWAENEGDRLRDHPSNLRFSVARNYNPDNTVAPIGNYGEVRLHHINGIGYTPYIDAVVGSNSGVAALNFAVNLQPSKIILLGYDMQSVGNRTHFHSEYSTTTPAMNFEDIFLPSLNRLASSVASANIINCSPNSKIDRFPKGKIGDHL